MDFFGQARGNWWLRRWEVDGIRYEPVSLSFPGEGEETFAPRGGRSFPRASLPRAPGLRPASWRCRPKHVKCAFSLIHFVRTSLIIVQLYSAGCFVDLESRFLSAE